MANKQILLAEDDLKDVELTLEAFEEYNLRNEIEIVRDGVEALEYLRRQGKYVDRPEGDPILVLLDLKMPRIDGIEVLEQLKQDPALRHIPVVMLTSSGESRDVTRAYELGANAYVVKPVLFDAFMEAVRRVGLFWVLTNQPSKSRDGG